MKADHFAEFRRHTENVGNAGNRVTARENPAETKDFYPDDSVTHDSGDWVTRVTSESSPAAAEPSVTHVTQAPQEWVTDPNSQKPKQNQGHSESVTLVTRVTRKNNDAGEIHTETDRITRVDAARREADRKAKRGYDFDPTAPSHTEYVDRADPLSDPGHPAYSIITTCRSYGIALRVDSDGTLVIGEAGARAKEPAQPWPSLIRAIEAHTEAVACLVAAGWHLRADFPDQNIQ